MNSQNNILDENTELKMKYEEMKNKYDNLWDKYDNLRDKYDLLLQEKKVCNVKKKEKFSNLVGKVPQELIDNENKRINTINTITHKLVNMSNLVNKKRIKSLVTSIYIIKTDYPKLIADGNDEKTIENRLNELKLELKSLINPESLKQFEIIIKRFDEMNS